MTGFAGLISHRRHVSLRWLERKKTDAGRLRLNIRRPACDAIWITLSSSKLCLKRRTVVSLTDFMPVRHRNSHLVRIVRGLSGQVPMKMRLAWRFDYGRAVPWVTRIKRENLGAIAGPDMAVLQSTERHRGENLQTFSEFMINVGETTTFVLTYGPSFEDLPESIDVDQALRETVSYWQNWIGRAKLMGEYAEAIERSLITLKALTYQPTGGIVGAPTTSLPECLGGERNWDYRYCWLRDATSTLLALMNAGYFEEAGAWRDWLTGNRRQS